MKTVEQVEAELAQERRRYNQCEDELIQALKERAASLAQVDRREQAEAALAEAQDALRSLSAWTGNAETLRKVESALSLTAGKGYLSPQEAETLRETLAVSESQRHAQTYTTKLLVADINSLNELLRRRGLGQGEIDHEAALVAERNQLLTELSTRLCSEHQFPDPLHCDICNAVKMLKNSNAELLGKNAQLLAQVAAKDAALLLCIDVADSDGWPQLVEHCKAALSPNAGSALQARLADLEQREKAQLAMESSCGTFKL